METNIIAKIAWVVIITAWNTTSIQYPEPKKPSLDADGLPSQFQTLEYRATGYNQSATIQSNQVMFIEYEGKTHEVILKSINIGTTNRTIYR